MTFSFVLKINNLLQVSTQFYVIDSYFEAFDRRYLVTFNLSGILKPVLHKSRNH